MKNLLSKVFLGAGIMALSAFPSKESIGQGFRDWGEGEINNSQEKYLDFEYDFYEEGKGSSDKMVDANLSYDGETMASFSGFDVDRDGRVDSVYLINKIKEFGVDASGKLNYMGLIDSETSGEGKFIPKFTQEYFVYGSDDTLDLYAPRITFSSRASHGPTYHNEPVSYHGKDFEKRFDSLRNSMRDPNLAKDFLVSDFYHNSKQFENRSSNFDLGVYTKKTLNDDEMLILY